MKFNFYKKLDLKVNLMNLLSWIIKISMYKLPVTFNKME